MTPIKLQLPLRYQSTSKKSVLYSLNQFLLPLGTEATRNTYHQYKAKKHLMELAHKEFIKYEPITKYPVDITLTLYRGSNHRADVGNLSIIEKFVTDAAVASGLLEDDSWKFVRSVTFTNGGLDAENPRADYTIAEYIHPHVERNGASSVLDTKEEI